METINQSSFLNEETNNVILVGSISNGFSYSHEHHGEKFYRTEIITTRKSGAIDTIPVIVSDRLVEIGQYSVQKRYKIEGQLRTYNYHDEEKTRLILYVFVKNIEEVDENVKDQNIITLIGYLCKTPIYRKTPNGREITDTIIAVNRLYGKSDYLPCICWGRNARFASTFQIGNRVKIVGRVQSREYEKRTDDSVIIKTAFEVSVNNLELI